MGKGARKKAPKQTADRKVADVFVAESFAGLYAAPELVAMREFVSSATAPLPLVEGVERQVTVATVLPMAAAAYVRSDGEVFLGLQVQTHSSDVSRDLGRSLRWALDAEPGDVLSVPDTSVAGKVEYAGGQRLQDLVRAEADLEVTLHKDFSFWLAQDDEASGEIAMSLERANEAIRPTERLGRGMYWVDAGAKAHLRWVRTEQEGRLLQAMARLSAAAELDLGSGSRYAGSFRAHGLLVPVWDLDPEAHASEWEQPAAELGARLDSALESLDEQALSSTERRARDGLVGRQFTLR